MKVCGHSLGRFFRGSNLTTSALKRLASCTTHEKSAGSGSALSSMPLLAVSTL